MNLSKVFPPSQSHALSKDGYLFISLKFSFIYDSLVFHKRSRNSTLTRHTGYHGDNFLYHAYIDNYIFCVEYLISLLTKSICITKKEYVGVIATCLCNRKFYLEIMRKFLFLMIQKNRVIA